MLKASEVNPQSPLLRIKEESYLEKVGVQTLEKMKNKIQRNKKIQRQCLILIPEMLIKQQEQMEKMMADSEAIVNHYPRNADETIKANVEYDRKVLN